MEGVISGSADERIKIIIDQKYKNIDRAEVSLVKFYDSIVNLIKGAGISGYTDKELKIRVKNRIKKLTDNEKKEVTEKLKKIYKERFPQIAVVKNMISSENRIYNGEIEKQFYRTLGSWINEFNCLVKKAESLSVTSCVSEVRALLKDTKYIHDCIGKYIKKNEVAEEENAVLEEHIAIFEQVYSDTKQPQAFLERIKSRLPNISTTQLDQACTIFLKEKGEEEFLIDTQNRFEEIYLTTQTNPSLKTSKIIAFILKKMEEKFGSNTRINQRTLKLFKQKRNDEIENFLVEMKFNNILAVDPICTNFVQIYLHLKDRDLSRRSFEEKYIQIRAKVASAYV